MKMEQYYYHITHIKNIESIKKDGLKANKDGEIFLFENKTVACPLPGGAAYVITAADHIAGNQVGLLDKYAMFEISADGIDVDLVNDNVAEMCSHLQWIAKQPIIKPEYISLYAIFKRRGERRIKNLSRYIQRYSKSKANGEI